MLLVATVVPLSASPAAGEPAERGLEYLVRDYQTRVPDKYTSDSWAPFAKALTTAAGVAGNRSAATSEVAAAKTALMNAAADLKAADEGTFETITNNTF